MPTRTEDGITALAETALQAAHQAAALIPPLWPLASSVAVNPYLGHTHEPLALASARLRRAAGVRSTLSRDWYARHLHEGRISDDDLAAALDAVWTTANMPGVAQLKALASIDAPPPTALPRAADIATGCSGIDWSGIVTARISHWAADYFDQGQALWAGTTEPDAYAAWRSVASLDLTPEIAGLKHFASNVARLPERAADALTACSRQLGLTAQAMPAYFHRLLIGMGGWSQMARYRQWQAELAGQHDDMLIELLAIALVWEAALHEQYATAIEMPWRRALASFAAPLQPTRDDLIDAVLQEAFERSEQRRLAQAMAAEAAPPPVRPVALQVAFCIDVRSEVFRRALESVDSSIQTRGLAGFFGMGVAYRRHASDVVEPRLPVLLHPQWQAHAEGGDAASVQHDRSVRIQRRAVRAWGRFKLAAISSFAFVEATGPVYITKLIRDALALRRATKDVDPIPQMDPQPALDDRLALAEGALRSMSLTKDFARLVVLAGHGAKVVNNPHASGLDCGACGGNSGEANARLMVQLLNDKAVRAGLVPRGIAIPADTVFVAGLHTTTTDTLTLFDLAQLPDTHANDVAQAEAWFATAGTLARAERARRLPGAVTAVDLFRRAYNWAEVRPEWALAGCQAFIVAPRHRTAGRNLGGRAFLHDYDWRSDEGFALLEVILTAPVVVASWISLQYYGSSVAPELFGAGNKLLHNVTGGIGVVEGNGGLLRAGLPWQSVHDGERLVHQPLRMSVLVDAPREAISTILARHPDLRRLFQHGWMHLFALDEQGRMAWRHEGEQGWRAMPSQTAAPSRPEPALA